MLLRKIYYDGPQNRTKVNGIGPALGIDLALKDLKSRNPRKRIASNMREPLVDLPRLPDPPQIDF